MVKKVSHIILSVLFLIITVGFAVSKHYCGGEQVATSFFTEADSCCESGDCCKDESKTFQLDADYAASSSVEVPETAQTELFAVALVLLDLNLGEYKYPNQFVAADVPPPPRIQTALSQKQAFLL